MSPAVKAALEASVPLARHIASKPLALGWLSQLHKHACKGASLQADFYRCLLLGYIYAQADHDLIKWSVTQQAQRDLQAIATTWEQLGQ